MRERREDDSAAFISRRYEKQQQQKNTKKGHLGYNIKSLSKRQFKSTPATNQRGITYEHKLIKLHKKGTQFSKDKLGIKDDDIDYILNKLLDKKNCTCCSSKCNNTDLIQIDNPPLWKSWW